jgi:hypothetical protein
MLAILLYVLYATRSDRAPAAAKLQEVVYTAMDFSFTGHNGRRPAALYQGNDGELHNFLKGERGSQYNDLPYAVTIFVR